MRQRLLSRGQVLAWHAQDHGSISRISKSTQIWLPEIFEDVTMPQPVCSLGVLVPRAVTQHLSLMDSVFLRLEALC